jgi:hypothetical protein
MQLECEVKTSLDMMKFFFNNREQFDDSSLPFFITQMKFAGALMTEIVNILLLCQQNSVMDCVLNFVALACIAEIDNYYASSLRDFKLKPALESEYLIRPKKEQNI